MIKRGEIYWANLDPTMGAEIKKTRPALVVSNDLNNLHSRTVTVLPLTSTTKRVYPFEVLLNRGVFGNKEPSKIKADQIRTIDKTRLGRAEGILDAALMAEVDEAMRLHLAL